MICYRFGFTGEKLYDGIFFHMMAFDYNIYHSHDYWELTICTSGTYEQNIGGKISLLRTNEATLISPGIPHSLKSFDYHPNSHIAIAFSNDFFIKRCNEFDKGLLSRIKKEAPIFIDYSFQEIQKIEVLLKNLSVSISKDEARLLTNLVSFNLLEKICFNNLQSSLNDYPRWFKDLLIQCNSNTNIKWKPNDAANYSHYTLAHLNRCFRKYLDTTLVDYLQKIKMNNAISLLTNSNLSLSEIVNVLGYNSVSYFSHSFKKIYGLSPYQYKLSFLKKIY